VKYHCRSVFSHRNAKYRPWIVSLDEMQPLPQEEPPDHRERIEELARHLTDYEHRVLNLILDGYSLGDIAASEHPRTRRPKSFSASASPSAVWPGLPSASFPA
jgi:hypothetical protein